MSKLQIWLFCVASLLLTMGLAALLFPFAAVPEAVVQRAQTPQAMETLPEIDLGPDFGPITVIDLVGFYLENPPQPQIEPTAPTKREHFGGC